MADIPRLNGAIRVLEQGKPAFVTFSPPEISAAQAINAALNPKGEILVVIMCEEVRAIKNLPKILEEVPGIGVVLIGEGEGGGEMSKSCTGVCITPIPTFPHQGGRSRYIHRLQ